MEDTEKLAELYESLDGTKLVKKVEYEGETVGIITWHGGHTLNFWNLEGKNTDMRSVGDFKYNTITPEEAEKKIAEYAEYIIDEISAHDEP